MSGTFINPGNLEAEYDSIFSSCVENGLSDTLPALTAIDSAVDLTSFKQHGAEFTQYFDFGISPPPPPSNTPSPDRDYIFSQTNSPGFFPQDLSQTSSPESTTSHAGQEPAFSPRPTVHLHANKTKSRAETQINLNLTLDPLDDRFKFLHFPRKTVAKHKLLATADDIKENEALGETISMDMFLVCATAVEKAEQLEQALRRARGEESVPRRPQDVAISDLDKADPAHPQNGGEVLICEGCKERERKRYGRKKKKGDEEDEAEYQSYQDDRVIIINEKEYKKWKDVEAGEPNVSSQAKSVEFAMRIACYCRHQEEKSPLGYRVIFTFKTARGTLVAQHLSEVFHITDDHKNNKEPGPEVAPHSLVIPEPYAQTQTQYPVNQELPPVSYGPSEVQYVQSNAMDMRLLGLGPNNGYSQPIPPAMANYSTPMTGLDYSQASAPTALTSIIPVDYSQANSSAMLPMVSPVDNPQTPASRMPSMASENYWQASASMALPFRQTGASFPTTPTSVTLPSQFPLPTLMRYNNTPLVSPMAQSFLQRPNSMDNFNYSDTPLASPLEAHPESSFLSRPSSMDNFSFNFTPNYYPAYGSTPSTGANSPIKDRSRAASPTWDQGRPSRRPRVNTGFTIGGSS